MALLVTAARGPSNFHVYFHRRLLTVNPFKPSDAKWLDFKAFSAVQV